MTFMKIIFIRYSYELLLQLNISITVYSIIMMRTRVDNTDIVTIMLFRNVYKKQKKIQKNKQTIFWTPCKLDENRKVSVILRLINLMCCKLRQRFHQHASMPNILFGDSPGQLTYHCYFWYLNVLVAFVKWSLAFQNDFMSQIPETAVDTFCNNKNFNKWMTLFPQNNPNYCWNNHLNATNLPQI